MASRGKLRSRPGSTRLAFSVQDFYRLLPTPVAARDWDAVEDAIYEALGVGSSEHLCVVTAVPDEQRGERLAVLHTGLPIPVDELWQRLNASELPKLWVPRKDMFHEVGEIPLLGSGKVALSRAKKIAAEIWTLAEDAG